MTWFLKLSCQESRILRDNPLGKADKNPILDTRVYNIEFSDGENAKLRASIITECMYAQCDIEGNQCRLMDHIVDHRKDNNVVYKDNQDVTVNGKGYRKKATRGWQLCIEWKDKSTTWGRLCDKKSHTTLKLLNMQSWWV